MKNKDTIEESNVEALEALPPAVTLAEIQAKNSLLWEGEKEISPVPMVAESAPAPPTAPITVYPMGEAGAMKEVKTAK